MSSQHVSVQTSVLAMLRGDVTASCVADRFGVTESQVHRWSDTFLVAGILALDDLLCTSQGACRPSESPKREREGDPIDPTTTIPPYFPKTTETP